MKRLVALVILAMIVGPGTSLAGDTGSEAQGRTVKSSKSNSSEREVAAPAPAAAAEASTIKGSKSNGDNRKVKSGKSNSSD